jgi:hypothetical protein
MGKHALVVVGLGLALAGCGSGKHQAAPLAKSTFVARADRICATAKTRSERVAELRALRAPAGDQALYARWLQAEEDAAAPAKPKPSGEDSKTEVDPLVLRAIADGKVTGYARRMGAETCAKRTIGTMPP